jgi:hypothetical protein
MQQLNAKVKRFVLCKTSWNQLCKFVCRTWPKLFSRFGKSYVFRRLQTPKSASEKMQIAPFLGVDILSRYGTIASVDG